MIVYVLQHEYEWYGRDECKFIGVYASREDAEAAVNRLIDQPGFKNWPDGFDIGRSEVGKDNWTSGFSTMITISVPLVGAEGLSRSAMGEWFPGEIYRICSMSDEHPGFEPEFRVGDLVYCEETEENIVAVRLHNAEV